MEKDCKYAKCCETLSDYCREYSKECPKYAGLEKETATRKMHRAFRDMSILIGDA